MLNGLTRTRASSQRSSPRMKLPAPWVICSAKKQLNPFLQQAISEPRGSAKTLLTPVLNSDWSACKKQSGHRLHGTALTDRRRAIGRSIFPSLPAGRRKGGKKETGGMVGWKELRRGRSGGSEALKDEVEGRGRGRQVQRGKGGGKETEIGESQTFLHQLQFPSTPPSPLPSFPPRSAASLSSLDPISLCYKPVANTRRSPQVSGQTSKINQETCRLQ